MTATGVIAYFYALQFTTEERSESTPVGRLAGRNFDRFWFSPNRDFVAVQREAGRVSVWVMPTGSSRLAAAELRNRFIPLAQTALYSVAPDASQLVHSYEGTLTVEKLFGNWPDSPQQKQIERDRVPVNLAMVEGGLLGVANASGAIDLLYTKDLKIAGSRTLPVKNPDVFESVGPFLLVASHTTSEAWVLDSRTLPRISLLEYLKFPPDASALTLTSSGRVAVGTAHGEVIAGAHLTAPGAVKFLQPFGNREYLVAGDFKGILLIAPRGPSREIAPVGPDLRGLAANSTSVAFATPDSVEVLSVHFVPATSPKVSEIARIWILVSLIVIAAYLLRGAILLYIAWRDAQGGLLRWLFGSGAAARSGRLPSTLDLFEPPFELIKSLNSGNCILWAGEELSSKAGMPGWASFVAGLLQWLEELRFVEGKQAEELQLLQSQGELDAVADSLQQVMENRPALMAEYVRSIYGRVAPLSGIHELLATIPFSGALTANLDALIEKTFAARSPRLFLPQESIEALSSVVEREFFVMKLRGVCEYPESVVLTPATAAAALEDDLHYRALRKEIFDTRTVLFVALTVAELEIWLAGLEPERRDAPDRTNYALVPVGEAGWERKAARLGKKYPVKIVTYPVDDTRALRRFLEKLAAAQARAAEAATA
jgi:hypothetical protein